MSYYNRYNRYNDPDYYWKADEKKIKRDFMNYANKERQIDADGYEKMGKTLGIDIYNDMFITYFVYKCGADSSEYITEDQYMQGMKAFKCNSLTEVKNKITNIKGKLLEIHDEDFRKFYNFLFNLNVPGSEKERKTKSIGLDAVEVYFKGLFCDQFKFMDEFLQFLKEKNVGLKWDEWNTFLDFLKDKGATFPKDYDYGSDYYPSIIDEFYIWYCKKHGIKIPDEEDEYQNDNINDFK